MLAVLSVNNQFGTFIGFDIHGSVVCFFLQKPFILLLIVGVALLLKLSKYHREDYNKHVKSIVSFLSALFVAEIIDMVLRIFSIR